MSYKYRLHNVLLALGSFTVPAIRAIMRALSASSDLGGRDAKSMPMAYVGMALKLNTSKAE